MGVIYKTVNLVNNKIYVGRDKHNNPKYFGSGKLVNLAFKKYGIENFRKDIIEECDADLLDDREKFWIKELHAQDPEIGYNIADGGHNEFSMTEYVRKQISENLKGKYIGENAFRHGVKLTDEHREKFLAHSMALKGKTFEEFYGEEKAAEIKSKFKGSWLDESKYDEHCANISKSKKGVPLSDKQRESISKRMMSHVTSENTKEKLHESNINKTQKHSIKISSINTESGEEIIYNNVNHASRIFNCSRYLIENNKIDGYIFTKLNKSSHLLKKTTYKFFNNNILIKECIGRIEADKFIKENNISCKIMVHKKWKNWTYATDS